MSAPRRPITVVPVSEIVQHFEKLTTQEAKADKPCLNQSSSVRILRPDSKDKQLSRVNSTIQPPPSPTKIPLDLKSQIESTPLVNDLAQERETEQGTHGNQSFESSVATEQTTQEEFFAQSVPDLPHVSQGTVPIIKQHDQEEQAPDQQECAKWEHEKQEQTQEQEHEHEQPQEQQQEYQQEQDTHPQEQPANHEPRSERKPEGGPLLLPDQSLQGQIEVHSHENCHVNETEIPEPCTYSNATLARPIVVHQSQEMVGVETPEVLPSPSLFPILDDQSSSSSSSVSSPSVSSPSVSSSSASASSSSSSSSGLVGRTITDDAPQQMVDDISSTYFKKTESQRKVKESKGSKTAKRERCQWSTRTSRKRKGAQPSRKQENSTK